jgi:hypothetical protein
MDGLARNTWIINVFIMQIDYTADIMERRCSYLSYKLC